MANVTKYRQKWLKYHKSYEKRAVTELRKVFKLWNNNIINAEFVGDVNMAQLALLTNSEDMYQAYYNIYYNIGIIHGKRVGSSINTELTKDFTIETFMQLFERELPML